MADNYVISKATLDDIAAQTMTLNGSAAAMTTEQMRQAVADANTEVAAQAAKIAELSTLLEEKIINKEGYMTGSILFSSLSVTPTVYYLNSEKELVNGVGITANSKINVLLPCIVYMSASGGTLTVSGDAEALKSGSTYKAVFCYGNATLSL